MAIPDRLFVVTHLRAQWFFLREVSILVPPLKGRHMRTRSVAVAVSALLVAAAVAYAPSANGQGNDSSLTASSLRADYRVDPWALTTPHPISPGPSRPGSAIGHRLPTRCVPPPANRG